MKRIAILGSTGSIGESTLDVIGRHPDRFEVTALVARQNVARLFNQCRRFQPRYAVMVDGAAAALLRRQLSESGCATEVLEGEQAAASVASADAVDLVMAAIVGGVGLAPTLAAARSGKTLLLANKESIVMAGSLFMSAIRDGGGRILPIDSEHNAVFQCLPEYGSTQGVRRIVLTASGGPFRQRTFQEMERVTPEEAVAHPNWSMGRKISVDSATLMNKGLEMIEAHLLFDLPSPQIDVVIHPQSIVHSMVEYVDGSTLAQLGHPDMRIPIAHALAWPERIESGVGLLDLAAHGHLDFEAPDPERFPCLRLARDALQVGGSAPCVLNAANEVAVEAFLAKRIRFTDIARLNEIVVSALGCQAAPVTIDAVMDLDAQARRLSVERLGDGSV